MVRINKDAKKQRKIRIFMGIFVIVVMVGSGIGMFASQVGEGNSNTKYNGYRFTFSGNEWITKISGKQYTFNYHPLDVVYLNITGNPKDLILNSKVLYMSNDPSSPSALTISRAEDIFASRLYSQYGKIVINGFSVQSEYDVPVITCENATSEHPVVMFEPASNDSVVCDGACVHIYSSDESGFFRAVDRLSYSISGVMD